MRALVMLVSACIAAGPAVAQDFVAYLKFTPTEKSTFNVALKCSGAPVCVGSYEVSIQESRCSNLLVLADDVTLTDMVPNGARSTPTQGRISFASLDVDETRNADGTCSFRELRDLAGTYATGPTGLLSASFVDNKGNTVAASQYLPYIVPEIASPSLGLDPVKTRIDASSASSTVRVAAGPGDVGTLSGLYVFALAPRALVPAADAFPKVGAASCALAQLDPATNRLVGTSIAGLRPTTTAVLSAQGNLVSVLGSVPTPQVAGASFFVGYGNDPATMVSQWANHVAVAVPGSQSCPTEMPASPGPLTGLWWNNAESGWGIHFTQRRNVVFAAWYGYQSAGSPKWHVASSCSMPSAGTTLGTCSGTLYEVNGPTFFSAPFTPVTPSQVSAAGTLQVDFADANHATLAITVSGVARRVPIVRQEFAAAVAPPAVDYTDLWWNPAESGWGLAVTHRSSVMFLAWYVYDGAGKPVWYVASECKVAADGSGCTGALYRTTGPPLSSSFNPALVQVFPAGTVSLTFLSPNVAVLEYTVGTVSDSKVVTRQIF